MAEIVLNNDLRVNTGFKQIISIALPITFAILVPQINLLTNNIFLGKHSNEALGNAGITAVFYLIFAVAGHGLSSAMQSVFSKYAGKNEADKFAVILSQGIRICIIVAFFGILITYCLAPFILQSVADTTAFPKEMSFLRIRIIGLPFLFLFQMGNSFLTASLNAKWLIVGTFVEAGTNILFDYLLIFGNWGFPNLGFNGAAWASIIAEFMGMLTVFTVIIYSGLKTKYGLLKNFSFNKLVNQEVVKMALPLCFQYVVSVTTWLVFFFFIEGLHNENAKSISNTMRNVFGLGGVFIWAFAATSNIMVSNLLGQNRENDVIKTVAKISLLSFLCCAIIVGLVNFFPAQFFGLFGQSNNFVALGAPVLKTVGIGMLSMSIANVWLNAITGTGKTTINLTIEIISILLYLGYSYYFTKYQFISLAFSWSNEIVYWTSILLASVLFFAFGKWRKQQSTT
jgi:multidrug resistance protein, MATE family